MRSIKSWHWLQNIIQLLLVTVVLGGCSGGECIFCNNAGTGGGIVGSYNLVVDTTAPVPLVNGSRQQFYVYVKNIGTGAASNLSWNLDDVAPATTKSTDSLLKWLKNSLRLSHDASTKPLQSNVSGIEIVDASNCINIAPGASCRILLNAASVDNVILQSKSDGTTAVTANLLSSYLYTPSYTSAEDTLSLSPLTPVNYGNGFAGYTFFIINNSNNIIELDEKVFGSLPAGIDYMMLAGVSCVNPMPAHSACQVRLVMSAPTEGSGSSTPVQLTPRGSEVGGDVLPPQKKIILNVSNERIGNVNAVAPAMVIDANSPGVTTKTGYISNTGSAPLTVGTLSTANPAVTIGSDGCSGKSLNPGETCYYSVSVDSTAVASSGTAVITIPYNNSKTNGSTSSSLNWIYIPLDAINPGITLTNNGNLTQENLSSTIVLYNSGNVPLRDVGTPSLNTSSRHVTLTNGDCTNVLAVSQSCYYKLTYNPAAPSEATTATVSGISAKYSDRTGKSYDVTFPTTTAVNVSSTFQGFVATGGDFTLNKATPSHTVTLTNRGTYNATIATVAINGANLVLSNDNCSGHMLAKSQSCTLTVSLIDSNTAASGNGSLVVTYDNHNGNSSVNSSSNINWIVGAAAALNVNFAQSNLVTNVGSLISTDVTLTNDGNTPLNNISLPAVAASFSWSDSSANSCAQNGTQNLAIGSSCNLKLNYAPTVSNTAGTLVTLGKFTATTGVGNNYSSSDYTITVTAIRTDSLAFASGGTTITSVNQDADWSNQSPQTVLTITNTNGSPITITSSSINGIAASSSGCNGALASGASCTLTISGTYSTSGSGTLTVNYNDSEGARSQTLPIIISYKAQPVINANLAIASNPSGTITLLNAGQANSITLTLTNTSVVQNALNPASDGVLKIKAASLIPTSVPNTTISRSGGTCPTADGDGYFTLSNQAGVNSCTYILNVTTTAVHDTQVNVVASSQYQKQAYSSPVAYAYSGINAGPDIAYNAIVQSATALLTTPVLVDSAQSNAFNGVDQGVSSPSVSFRVENVGEAAVNGNITAPMISGFSFDMTNCNNLAANSSCTFSGVLNSVTVVSGNLSSSQLTYDTTKTTNLPAMAYAVVAAASPAITVTTSVANCQKGTGLGADTCLINTGNPAPVITITFTNTGSATASNFNASETNLGLGDGYNQTSVNNCNNVTLTTNASCSIVVTPTTGAAVAHLDVTTTGAKTSETSYDMTPTGSSNVSYSYNYGSSNQFSGSGATALPAVNTTVAVPTLTIGAVANIAPSGSTTTKITYANWYGSSNPSAPTIALEDDYGEYAVTSSGCAAWDNTTATGGDCTLTLTGSSATGGSNYYLDASATMGSSGTIGAAPQTFMITIPDGIVLVSPITYAGNLSGYNGADTKCQTAGNTAIPGSTGWKAMLDGSTSTIGNNYYRYDSSKSPTYKGILIGTRQQLNPANMTNAVALDNPIATTDNYFWYGAGKIYGTNTMSGSSSCMTSAAWVSSSSSIAGAVGKLNTVNPYSIGYDFTIGGSPSTVAPCNVGRYLVCIYHGG